MNNEDMLKLIQQGEDSRVQFKKMITRSDSLAAELVAFANSKGGKLIIGVADNKQITGLSPEDIEHINQLISNAANNLVRPAIYPETEIVTIGETLVLVILVNEGISKPYQDNQGSIWVKSGSDKRRVTAREEIQRMLQSSGSLYSDEIKIAGSSIDDIDSNTFSNFFYKQYEKSLEAFLKEQTTTFQKLLNNLVLANGSNLNLAGLMLFGKNPQRYRPIDVVKAISFVGNDDTGSEFRDKEDIEGCLISLYKQTMSFLTRNLRKTQSKDGFNTGGSLEVPLVVLEELIANMLIHRDYFISAPCRVMIFDDRIELINPGSLPNSLQLENILNGISVIRNPILASYAAKKGYDMPYSGLGTGIRRALKAEPDLKFEADYKRNLFIAIIPRKESYR